MKNLNPYQLNSFDYFQLVCSRKQNTVGNPNYLANLLSLEPNISILYDRYDQSFQNNDLAALAVHGFVGTDDSDLRALYQYKSKSLQELRTILTTTDHGRVVKCQHCTINGANSFDHFLPQSEFVEFMVHPLNLIPCCTECNGHKSNNWRNGQLRTALNLYLDQLPALQYLFVEFEIGNHTINTQFYLNNVNSINGNLFSMLEDHYDNLELYRRFAEEADGVVSSFKDTIEVHRGNNSLIETRQFIKQILQKEQAAFGFNYWQSIIKLELIDNDDFLIDFD
ncbi:hypothetical protein [Pedobacter sp. MR22-3]|uniref:hypothetical protein n=1 Tax=Pedobacter sp. MR22-3 TaxID=2994552 RepID=UPI002245EB51|nr:hypothetical protein [Pedobacter sp. MR22-3]MCX2584276.1 hypothetical protein [Pedobacter sp. MR22-3]